MFDRKWKILIVSMLAYQVLLTWCMFELIDVAAYFSRLDCGEWCYRHTYGYILTNQGASDVATLFVWGSVLLIAGNLAVWIWSAIRRGRDAGSSAGRDQD